MAAINNRRHEIFAQELAKGKSASAAYREAGYKHNEGNCIRLKGNERVQARVAELIERAAIKTEVTVESLTKELEEARQVAVEIKQPGAAVAAVMGKAKLAGLIVEKRESGSPGAFSGTTAEEREILEDAVRREAQSRGLRIVGGNAA